MEPGYRGALIDLFRRGEPEAPVRLLAARGGLAAQADEQVALLMLLLDDPDPDVARAAEATIAALPAGPLAALLARADAPEPMRAFFAARGILPGPEAAADVTEPLVEPPDAAPAVAEEHAPTVVLSSLPVTERMKLASKGSREQRAQLIRDSNRLVATAVLSSPKLNDNEVEAFAKMANVSEEVLRIIGTNRTWLKSYAVVLGLTRNPKTPPGISMQLLHRLIDRDVKALSTDRNVPEALRLAARRKVTQSQR